jgi:hypothetical protein
MSCFKNNCFAEAALRENENEQEFHFCFRSHGDDVLCNVLEQRYAGAIFCFAAG